MCEKCALLDRKIDHYTLLLLTVDEREAVEGLASLIAQHEATKRALHPDEREISTG